MRSSHMGFRRRTRWVGPAGARGGAELAAAEQLLRNSPEATPITAASPANKARESNLVDKT